MALTTIKPLSLAFIGQGLDGVREPEAMQS